MRPMDHGNAWSLYFRDPEGNRLEVFCDTQWYIEQPCIEDLDLSQPAEQIRAKSDAFCRNAPGLQTDHGIPGGNRREDGPEKILTAM